MTKEEKMKVVDETLAQIRGLVETACTDDQLNNDATAMDFIRSAIEVIEELANGTRPL